MSKYTLELGALEEKNVANMQVRILTERERNPSRHNQSPTNLTAHMHGKKKKNPSW